MSIQVPSASGRTGLWAITSYFNPMRYRRRRANYRLFRERLKVPLVAVELAYGSEFELNAQDAEILIQLRGSDVLWQKERLLNLALQALPESARKVAWIDADVIFAADDWLERASHLLDRFMLVQLFDQAYHLVRDWVPGEPRIEETKTMRPAVSFAIASDIAPAAALSRFQDQPGNGPAPTPGHAWAARRELLDEHGFYDAMVIGGTDRAIACAGYGCFEQVMRLHYMNGPQRTRYLAWAEPFHRTVRGSVTFLDCNLFHLWHGDLVDRRPTWRCEGFSRFDFDPFRDIAIDENGCWRWNSDKPEMHRFIVEYLGSRREDG